MEQFKLEARSSKLEGNILPSSFQLLTSSSYKGFTLIEIIMAMAILTIGIIGVVRLLPVGLRASKSAEMFSKAAFLAQGKMEELKLAGIEKLTAEQPAAALQGEEGEYSWQAQLAQVSLAGVNCADDIRQLNLTISWTEKGRPYFQEFVTFVHR